jgi:hypothetical protein
MRLNRSFNEIIKIINFFSNKGESESKDENENESFD